MFEMTISMFGMYINTIKGKAFYYGTEIEDKKGKWNDNYNTSDGFYLQHQGIYHYIYRLN